MLFFFYWWEYSQEMILLTPAFPSTSCCKFSICLIFQACHVKISSHSFPPEFLLQLRPHSAHMIMFQSALRFFFFYSFSFPIAAESSITYCYLWVTEWISSMHTVCLDKRCCCSGWGQVWYKDIFVPIVFSSSNTVSSFFHAAFLFIIYIYIYFWLHLKHQTQD